MIAVATLVLCNTPVPQLLISLFLAGLLLYEGVISLIYLYIEIKNTEKQEPEIDEHQKQVEEIENNNQNQVEKIENEKK